MGSSRPKHLFWLFPFGTMSWSPVFLWAECVEGPKTSNVPPGPRAGQTSPFPEDSSILCPQNFLSAQPCFLFLYPPQVAGI